MQSDKQKWEIALYGRRFFHLRNFTLSIFEVELLLKEDVSLPPFKGSAFRGGLAWGVKKASCTEGKKSCSGCSSSNICAYSYLFESCLDCEVRTKEIPRPYLLQLTDGGKVNYFAGETLNFRLVLIGKAVKTLPFILLGLDHFSVLGLGAKRAAFAMKGVFAINPLTGEKKPVYTPSDGYKDNIFILSGVEILKSAGFDFSSLTGKKRIELEFLTPTRLAEKGELVKKPSLGSIARAALRRLSFLTRYYGEGDFQTDFKTLVTAAEKATLIRENLKWVELKRYSNRRGMHLFISGFVGPAEYEGEIGELLPYLYLARFCHIGKGTVYGLGAYSLKLVM